MHLLIPYASALSEGAAQALAGLELPNLAQLLARLSLVQRDDADVYTLSAPHERALAAAQGWQGADGCLPFAAHAAALDGIDIGALAWGLVTPAHWHVGRDHVTLVDPAALNLTPADSKAAFDAVRDLFESEGFRFEWGAPLRWYAAHAGLADLPCASLDRAIGRNVDLWLRAGGDTGSPTRLLRRLQSELQLLLYPHPVNEAREQRGELALNSFWLSGCGRPQPLSGAAPRIDDSLRAPALADDWAGWAQAWQALDAGTVAEWLAALRAGRPVTLTLCGERSAHRFEPVARSAWQQLAQRWQKSTPQLLLGAL